MPVYEYRCDDCQHLFEEWTRRVKAEDEAQTCPVCRGRATRVISHTSFALKGGGWYMTDYGTLKNRDKRDNCKDASAACPANGDCSASGCCATEAAPAAGPTASEASAGTPA
ncbi:MAG: zinc ribbon domain-containing protein [Desulfovibrio sp.]|nr:zinc ribbon domain-containing protein [Desulfovibrio sp.]